MLKNALYRYGPEHGRIPAHLQFGQEIFDRMIQHKDIVALINADTGDKYTYGELAQQTADVAVALTRLGVKKGDVVSVCSEKRYDVIPSILGLLGSGAAYAPMDITFGSFSLLHRLNLSKPKVVFCSEAALKMHKATMDSADCVTHYIVYDSPNGPPQDEVFKSNGVIFYKDFVKERVNLADFTAVPVDGWTDYMLIMFSSGTTGLPKGVPVTHLAFLLNVQSFVLDNYRSMPILITREWYYTYGLMYTLSLLWAGATIVYTPNNQVEDMLKAIQKYKAEIIQLNPSTITGFVKTADLAKYDLSSLKYMLSASTPVGSELIIAMKEQLPTLKDIIQLYGMSEAGSICNEIGAPKGSKPGSSGLPSLGFTLKVVDHDTREPLGPNQRGEVCIRGPSVMPAYLHNANPDCKDEEGFLKTGDIGYYDEDGYVFIINRIKELIKYNDLAIAPAELEAVLLQHPCVRDAGVVGCPHPKHGQVPVAFVELQPGATISAEELVAYVNSKVSTKTQLAGGVRFLDKMPMGAGEKLDRKVLKQMLE